MVETFNPQVESFNTSRLVKVEKSDEATLAGKIEVGEVHKQTLELQIGWFRNDPGLEDYFDADAMRSMKDGEKDYD